MGDDPNDGRSGLSLEVVEKAYRELEAELDRPPVSFELADKLGVCRRTLLRHVGSYKDLVRRLSDGQPLPRRRHRSPRGRIKDEELVAEYYRLEKKLGHTPSFDEMNEHGKYSPTLYVVRFGSWSGFVQEMGGTQRVHRLDISRPLAEQTYHELCDKLGRRPTLLEVCDKLGISVRGFYNHFGLYKDFRQKMTDQIVG
jgi:AraC-like DNA-binding protein